MDQTALIAKFREVIIANELDGDLSYITRFSDPDGVRTGKSGWSFGISQFDLLNNPTAAACLRACNFTPEEIAGLKAQTVNTKALESKLKANAAVIERFDEAQLKSCVTRTQSILSRRGIIPADATALLSVADYANQYYLSDVDKPGYLVHYLLGLKHHFTAQDVLDFKLDHTAFGRKFPKDCKRRYANLIRIMGAESA